LKNEGASGDVDENKGPGKEGVRYQVLGVRKIARGLRNPQAIAARDRFGLLASAFEK
jgi:hypothetical protein